MFIERYTTHNLCLLGFGNVARALVRLLEQKNTALREQYGIGWRITGIASRRLGWIANPYGLPPAMLLSNPTRVSSISPAPSDVRAWIKAARADVMFELSSLNPYTGQPAIDHLRAALDAGAHAITANKGPVVYAFEELKERAWQVGRRFLFEATVMDGVPIFSLFREALPAANLKRFRGILNSTTNVILTEIEIGMSFDEAVLRAQEIGVAETDPSADIDGWDAAVKVAALATVLMGVPLKPTDVAREGIRALSASEIRAARAEGRPFKLVCKGERTLDGSVRGSVMPEQLPLSDPLASVRGTSSMIHFETDMLPGITIVEHNPSPETTAYGLLADFINAVR